MSVKRLSINARQGNDKLDIQYCTSNWTSSAVHQTVQPRVVVPFLVQYWTSNCTSNCTTKGCCPFPCTVCCTVLDIKLYNQGLLSLSLYSLLYSTGHPVCCTFPCTVCCTVLVVQFVVHSSRRVDRRKNGAAIIFWATQFHLLSKTSSSLRGKEKILTNFCTMCESNLLFLQGL